jgi:23S rRNA A1618 N6-methylase RlmF
MQGRGGFGGLELHIARAAFRAVAKRHGHRFKDGRLARPVFTDEKRHIGMELDLLQITHRRDIEGVAVKIDVNVGAKCSRKQVGFAGYGHDGPGVDLNRAILPKKGRCAGACEWRQ